jgi:hypothetical protein
MISTKQTKGFLSQICRNKKNITTFTVKSNELSQEEMDSICMGMGGVAVELTLKWIPSVSASCTKGEDKT